MRTQNQIRRRLAEPPVLEQVKQVLESNAGWSRTQVARHLCEELGFHDARGERQESTCLKALRTLEAKGLLKLPASRANGDGPAPPKRLGEPVPPAQGVPDKAGAVADLRLIVVDSDEEKALWNELMFREHPQGKRPMVGRQLRYLIGSGHGWLGGLGFGAAALHLRARDEWIGWDWPLRQAYLERVVCMNRFLIRPDIRCKNLASRVLGMAVRAFEEDFEQRFAYAPWLLESFVDTSQFLGTCYRAANWFLVGQTQGRGRQDRLHTQSETVKDIYVYPLVPDFRQQMGLPAFCGHVPLPLDACLGEAAWAEREFGTAPLGDKRLTARAVQMGQLKYGRPDASFTALGQGDAGASKAFYRFIEQPDASAVTMENIMAPHRESTIQRMMAHKTVLAIQDTTDLNYSELSQCQGLGVIGKNQTKTTSQGLRLHSTLALTDTGLPLGVLRALCYAPELKPEHTGKDSRYIPIEEKETFRWITGMQNCMAVSRQLRDTEVICVMDREGDFFELFEHWRQDPCVELLIRAKHDRRSSEDDFSLFESVRKASVQAQVNIEVPRRSAKPKKGKRPARAARPARTAQVSLRYKPVKLCPPKHGLNSGKAPVAVWLVHLIEDNPPEDQEPIEHRFSRAP